MPTTARPSAGPLAAWSAVLLLTLYLVFAGGAWQGIYTAEIRLVTVALAGLALAAWAAVAVRRPEWRPRSVLLPVIAAMLASLALSTALSRYPRFGVEYLGYAVLLAALYLLLVRLLADPFVRARFGALAVSLCGAISFAYLVLVLRHWIDWWGLVGRITLPPLRPDFESLVWGNPAAVLTITVLLLGPAVAHIGTSTAAARAVVGLLVVMVGAVAVLSGSRAGWVAIGVTLALLGGVRLATQEGRASLRATVRWVSRSRSGRVVLGVGAVGGIVGIAILAPAIVRRFAEGGEQFRTAFVAAAVRMFVEAPLVGTGPGTWVVQRIRYTVPPEADYYIPHAHDIYAQTLAELGLLGVVAGLVLAAGLAWLVRDAVRDADPVRRRWGWLTLLVLIYFAAHQVLDFYANMPAILFAAALPVAWLDATAPRVPRIGGRWVTVALGRTGTVVAAIALVVALAGLAWTEIPASTHARAVALANGGDWGGANSTARAAVTMDPDWPPYQLTEGLTASRAGDHARAAAAFRRVVEIDGLPEAWLDLAAEEASRGEIGAATDAIREALRLGYQRPVIAIPAGDLALRLGAEPLAREAFTNGLAAAPSLAGDPWWTADLARAALFPAVRDAALARLGPTGWELALASGDPDRARSVALGLESGSAAFAAKVIDAWTGDAGAMGAVLDECAARPLDVAALTWCARLEGRSGNDGEANRYRAWANTILGGSYAAGAEVRVRSGEQVGRSDAGNPALFYGHYTYRRPTPWDLLVPSLVHLTLE